MPAIAYISPLHGGYPFRANGVYTVSARNSTKAEIEAEGFLGTFRTPYNIIDNGDWLVFSAKTAADSGVYLVVDDKLKQMFPQVPPSS